MNLLELRNSLYRTHVKHAGLIWHDTKKRESESIGVTELQTAPCIFKAEDKIVIYYVQDLFIFPSSK